MNPQVWGHRGCRGAGSPPENSLDAFKAAIESGAGGIELDVQLSKDGALMVFHDDTLDRMTGVAGEIAAFRRVDLKKLRLLNTDGKPSKQSIPTLEDVLDLMNDCGKRSLFVVNIELKDPKSAQAAANVVSLRLAGGWKVANFLVSSFHIDSLREFRSLLPLVPIGVLSECSAGELPRLIKDTADLKPSTINIPLSSLTPEALELIKNVKAEPVVWAPGEAHLNHLSQTEREALVERLRHREFVMITDFPKEFVQALKPNKARATATGVLAACLAYNEREMLFRPTESGLTNLLSPAAYPELKRFGFTELSLTSEDGVPFTVWERIGYFDRPHFLLFHGNRAHWGDTGPGDPLRDRRARLKFIEELASSGAGVTAVTLRGFGRSTAQPSELGFTQDVREVSNHLMAIGVDHKRLIIVGESLGTWAATQAGAYLTANNRPPAQISLQNPFTCMADLGEQVISHFPIVRSLSIRLSAAALDRHVLKNHFYTARLFQELSPSTVIHIATSGKDDLVPASHSDKLAQISLKLGLPIVRDLYPDALHHNIPPVDFARKIVRLGVESCPGTSDCAQLWGEATVAKVAVDHMPYL
jgi:glycerophosphoryl diester phosphodiesterase